MIQEMAVSIEMKLTVDAKNKDDALDKAHEDGMFLAREVQKILKTRLDGDRTDSPFHSMRISFPTVLTGNNNDEARYPLRVEQITEGLRTEQITEEGQ